jgi:hypothetical protein
VLCSIIERTLQPSRLDGQQQLVDYFHKEWSPAKLASLLLRVALQETFVILRPNLSARQLLRELGQGRLPAIDYTAVKFNRRRTADYGLVDVEDLTRRRMTRISRELRDEPPISPAEWRHVSTRLAGFAKAIQARGGKVVFIRFPSRGRFEALTDELFPRAEYWDPLAAVVEAAGAETIHYEDMPGNADLKLPDESHLDVPSAIAFTRWLAQELVERGVLHGR